jgi:hypothetical protein
MYRPTRTTILALSIAAAVAASSPVLASGRGGGYGGGWALPGEKSGHCKQ